MHNRLHRGPAHRHLYNMKLAPWHAIKSGRRRMYLNWSQAEGRSVKKSEYGWKAATLCSSVIQPPTTAPLCSAASVATPQSSPNTDTHVHSSTLPLSTEMGGMRATQEACFHPRYPCAAFGKPASRCPIMAHSNTIFSFFFFFFVVVERLCPRRPGAHLSASIHSCNCVDCSKFKASQPKP